MSETPTPIDKFTNYAIDESGNVYRIIHEYDEEGNIIDTSYKMLKQYLHGKKTRVQLWHNKKRYTIFAHILVAQTFIPVPDHLHLASEFDKRMLIVKHKNGDLRDNRVSNLAWTHSRNNRKPYCYECNRFHLPKEDCL